MSRIGKKPIIIPEKTEVKISGNHVSVKGPLGEISRDFMPEIVITMEGKTITLKPTKETIESSALWGTCVAHIQNMVKGVNQAFQKKLILEGIGFKSEVKGDELLLSLGFSHQVKVKIPKGLKVTAEKNNITVSGIDKESVGQFSAQVRGLKKPEPYKGKGFRYDTEVIRRKQGKKTV